MGVPAFLFQPFAETGQQTNDVEPISETRNYRNKSGLKITRNTIFMAWSIER